MKAFRAHLAVFLTSSVALSCGSSARPFDEGDADGDALPECGDERLPLDPSPEPIVNGTASWDPAVVDLTEGQALAVGAFMTRDGGGWTNVCTATLVAPRLVLTAAHCVADWSSWPPGTLSPSEVRFGVGEDMRYPVALLEPSGVHDHPSYRSGWGGDATNDVAVLVFDEDAAESVPGIEPIPANCSPLDRESFIGQDVQNVGYGTTEPGWGAPPNTRRFWTVEEVTDLSSSDFTVYGHGESAVCSGDSGGPSLWSMPDGVIRVVGTVSWGDPSCVDYDHFARADDNCDFFADYLEGCGDLSAEGSCEEDVAVFCEGGTVMRVDCGATGRTCGDVGDGRMRCLGDEDPCDGESFEGRCDGDDAVWCDDGEVERQSCSRPGERCGETDAGLYRCVGGGGEPCGDLDWSGECVGDEAHWCEDDVLRVRRCGDCDQECGWSETHNGYYCI